MNQDQARRVAEEVELPKPHEWARQTIFGGVLRAYTEEQVREAIAGALVKYTQQDDPATDVNEGDLPIPSQQEERVRELESVLDVVLNQLKKWQANGGVKSGYEFIDVAITVIDAARSKEQGK